MLPVLKVRLLRGFIVMQIQACFSSIVFGANTTGTSILAPSIICNPAAKMENSYRTISR